MCNISPTETYPDTALACVFEYKTKFPFPLITHAYPDTFVFDNKLTSCTCAALADTW